MATPVLLVEVEPRRAADGVSELVRLAGLGGSRPYYYAGQHWRGGIVGAPTFKCALDFQGQEFGSDGVPQVSALEWGTSRHADLAAVSGYVWEDAAIVVRIGPEGSMPPVRLAGKITSGTIEAGKLLLTFADPAADLKKPLLTDRYLGTGELEGPAEWEGKIKRRLFGRVWNVLGELIDPAYSIFAYADPTRPLDAFVAVRDMGAPAAAMGLVAWQGTMADTLTALRLAQAPQGGGIACPSIGCVKWWTTPAGDLCADIRGEVGAGYVETTAEIAQRLVEGVSGPAFAAGTIAAAVAARPAPVGWVADADNTLVSDMLAELLGNSSLLWMLDAESQIVIREWAWGPSVASVRSHEVRRTKSFKPLATRKLGYQRNENQMARTDIAGAVLAGLVSSYLTSEAITLAASTDGVVSDYSTAIGEFVLLDGALAGTGSLRALTGVVYSIVSAQGVTMTIDEDTGAYAVTEMPDGTDAGLVRLRAVYGDFTFEKVVSIAKVRAGSIGEDGANGTPAASAHLTGEAFTVFAYANGDVVSYAGVQGQFKVFSGATDVSADFTLTTAENPQNLTIVYNDQAYAVTGGFSVLIDQATFTIRATGSGDFAGVFFDKVVSIVKAKGGYEIVAALPTTNLFIGRMVFLDTDKKLYRFDGADWTNATEAGDIIGQLVAHQIGAGEINAAHINVTQLSAISATIGTLRTAITGARTEISDNLIEVFDGNNVLRVRLGIWS